MKNSENFKTSEWSGNLLEYSRKFAKKIYFTQKYCENNRSNWNSIKKPKKRGEGEGGGDVGGTVRVLWGCGGGAQNEDWFFPENSVNFFEKPTFYFKI